MLPPLGPLSAQLALDGKASESLEQPRDGCDTLLASSLS